MGLYYTKTPGEYDGETHWGRILLTFALVAVAWVLVSWFVYPSVRIYKQNLAGEANLRQQEWEKKIAIEEAKALKESAVLKAEAEVARAKGVAEANQIISGSLKGNEEYLRYLWIDQLANGQAGQIIYVPTEAGLPILEAGKR